MEDVYAIGMKLTLSGTIKTDLSEVSSVLDKMAALLKDCQKSLDSMAASTAKFKTASAGVADAWAATARAMKDAADAAGRMGNMPIGGGGGGGGGPRVSPGGGVGALPWPTGPQQFRGGDGTGSNSGGFTFPGALVPYTGSGSGFPPWPGLGVYPGVPGSGGTGFRGSLHEAATMAMPAYAGMAALTDVYGATAPFVAMQAVLRGMGFSVAQANAAGAGAMDTTRSVPGSSPQENLEITRDLQAVLQDPNSAIAMTPQMAQLGVVLGAYGKGGTKELTAAIRAGEYRGVLSEEDGHGGEKINAARMAEFVNSLAAATALSGGTIGPEEFLKFLRSSGGAGANLDDNTFFSKQLALMLALGPAKAGNAVQGLNQQFGAGKMSKVLVGILSELGILSQDPEKYNEDGMKGTLGIAYLKHGAISQERLNKLRDDPGAFILQELLPAVQDKLKHDLGDQYTNASDERRRQMEIGDLQQITSRVPGGTEAAETLRNALLIARDQQAYQRQIATGSYGDVLTDNPLVQQRALGGAYQGLLISAGMGGIGGAMDGMTSAMHFLTDLSDWASSNAATTKAGLEGLAAGVAVFAAGSVASIAMAALASPVAGFAALAAGVVSINSAIDSVLGIIFGETSRKGSGTEIPGLIETIKDIYYNRRDSILGLPLSPAPGAPGSAGGPIPVHVVNIDSMHQGAINTLARQATMPPIGGASPDYRIDPGVSLLGGQ